MRATVPASTVDNSYELFPIGYYNGAIAKAELRDPKGDGSWLVLKLAMDDVTAREGTPEPGRERFQSDITIKNDGTNLFDVEDFSKGDLPFPVRRAAGLLAGLGEALGVAKRENGQVSVDMKAVAEALIAGEFTGQKVGFEVSHFKPKKEGGQPRDQYQRFGPAS